MKEEHFDRERYEEAFKKVYSEKYDEFEEIMRKKLIISVVGSVNAGKSSTINALTGIRYAEVKAKAGWTKEISLYELKKGVFIADTPGLHDIDEKSPQKAYEFIEKETDIVLFFLNAARGLDRYEKEAFKSIQSLRKETIVVLNKIDTIDEDEVHDVVAQIEEELGVQPIPVSAKNGTNIEKLHDRILKVLKTKGKDLLFAKVSNYKERIVAKWIRAATTTAAGIGALPIPGSDIVPLTALQVGLAMKIAHIYGISPSEKDIMNLIASTVTGTAGRRVMRWGITALKTLGWVPGGQLGEVATCSLAAVIAGGITYSFGWACNAYYKSGMGIEMDELGKIFDQYYNEYKSNNA